MWIYPSGETQLDLRRYCPSEKRKCPSVTGHGYCDASVVIGKVQKDAQHPSISHDDGRWPTQCACGYHFHEHDEWQANYRDIYRNQEGTWEGTLRNLPPGAVYDAHWYPESYKVNGQYLVVVCPDGWKWEVDSMASNCDKRDDKIHKCWVRHGRAEDGTLHVDKNGITCNAGAGSILTPNYHGFLRHGILTEKY